MTQDELIHALNSGGDAMESFDDLVHTTQEAINSRILLMEHETDEVVITSEGISYHDIPGDEPYEVVYTVEGYTTGERDKALTEESTWNEVLKEYHPEISGDFTEAEARQKCMALGMLNQLVDAAIDYACYKNPQTKNNNACEIISEWLKNKGIQIKYKNGIGIAYPI